MEGSGRKRGTTAITVVNSTRLCYSAAAMAQTYFISAGECSGDLLGAELITALRTSQPDLQPFGLCGPAMREAGGEALADFNSLAVIGVAELWTKLHRFRHLERSIVSQIARRRPRFAVLIDYPGLHFRLAELLKLSNVSVFQYVAPKTWAWGEKRTAALASDFKAVFGILPFEKFFFQRRAVNYHYVGTPLLDRIATVTVPPALQELCTGQRVLACLPGSRDEELRRHLPLVMEVLASPQLPPCLPLLPLAPSLSIAQCCALTGLAAERLATDVPCYRFGKAILVEKHSLAVLKLANAALVASGTATLECALSGVPAVVFYKTSPLTYALAKNNININFISLINIMGGKQIVREFIQDFAGTDLINTLQELLNDNDKANLMRTEYQALTAQLHGKAAQHAAQLVTNYLH